MSKCVQAREIKGNDSPRGQRDTDKGGRSGWLEGRRAAEGEAWKVESAWQAKGTSCVGNRSHGRPPKG